MKNKKMHFLIGWLINFVVLTIIILLPKTTTVYTLLYILTMVMIFIIPLLLTLCQTSITIYSDDYNKKSFFLVTPNFGCIMMILLTFLNFIKSIETIAKAQMVTIMLVFIALEMMLAMVLMVYKINKKQYIWLEIATYFSLVLFFFCAMIISVDFGLI